ncbi:hypothetical protein [Roseibacillus persicicus]|uniref:hypothetical protein n=1 Tax=Roseibacillus persicicus TaxID=454148 RepID=UPI00280D14D7|nr:hypothetical protein [Roseibacillus persicicus]MDQ8192445.1 hypothetical protein [Roseibacillus persicicus]
MTPSNAEYSSLLSDVRQSYRLLHDYQRLILDSLKYIGNQLNMPYRGGSSRFSKEQPGKGKGELGNYGWDWLGMYAYEFRFEYRHGNRRGIPLDKGQSVTLTATVFSDTGYYQNEETHQNKQIVDGFASTASSSSKVVFCLFAEPSRHLSTLYEPKTIRALIAPNAPWPSSLAEESVFGFCREVSDLFTQDSADRLVDELVNLASHHNIPIYRTGQAPHEREQPDSEPSS